MLYIQWTLGSNNNKSASRETGNKQENYSLLPKESFWQVVQGDVLFMAEDRTIPKLRRWTWKSMESKVLRVHREEYWRGENYTQNSGDLQRISSVFS